METKFMQMLKAARRVSQPTICVSTPDPNATVNLISAQYKNDPQFVWDCLQGLRGKDNEGESTNQQILDDLQIVPDMTANITEMLLKIQKLPKKSIVFAHNLQFFIKDPATIQALANLRDIFKQDFRTLIGLGPFFELPHEIEHDVLLLDEPLPTPEEIREIVKQIFKDAGLKTPTDEILDRATDGLTGLATFTVETATAMSLTKDGLDFDRLWERKRKSVEGNKGISVYRGTEKFADIVGMQNVKKFCNSLIHGKRRVRVVVFIDEIEKHVSNAGIGDTTGEMMAPLLSAMQDNDWRGILCVGVPGGGKSMLSKALGNEAECLTLLFDFSGMKGSLVGESGAAIRQALKVVFAIGGKDALFIATSNNIEQLSPEFRRRFEKGTFYFDLMTEEEREAAWQYYGKKFDVDVAKKLRPVDEGWTAAEIKVCCQNAWELGMSLKDSATYIVPVSKSGADKIAALRKSASGKYISASKTGIYRYQETAASGRGIEMGE